MAVPPYFDNLLYYIAISLLAQGSALTHFMFGVEPFFGNGVADCVELMKGSQKGYAPKQRLNCGRWLLQQHSA